MKHLEQLSGQPDTVRDAIITELASTLQRLALDHPRMDGALLLRLVIGYFAGVHAKNFGHVETISALLKIARRGLRFADEEINSQRQ